MHIFFKITLTKVSKANVYINLYTIYMQFLKGFWFSKHKVYIAMN